MNETIIGYFVAHSGKKRQISVLVEIEIPSIENTNLNRPNIYDKYNAEYITNNYIVKKIYDKEMNEYSLFYTDYFSKEIRLGETVVINNKIKKNKNFEKDSEKDSDEDSEEEYKEKTQTFYLTKKRAIGDDLNNYFTYKHYFTYTTYHKNGHKHEEGTILNGKKNGKYYQWLSDGKLYEDVTYLCNQLHGECKFFHEETGELEEHNLYENDNLIEYLDVEITKKKIDKIKIDNESTFVDLDSIYQNDDELPITKNIKEKKSKNSDNNEYYKPQKLSKRKKKITNKFVKHIQHCFDIIDMVIIIPVKKKELVEYKNNKIKSLMQYVFDICNTTYAKTYLESQKSVREYINDLLHNVINYITKLENCDLFKVYLENIQKNTFFL